MQLLCFVFGCITSIALFHAWDISLDNRNLRESNQILFKENLELREKVRERK